MFDYYKERENVWKRLQKSGVIIDYARHGDAQKYDIHLRDGLIIAERAVKGFKKGMDRLGN